jgi:hypothetical protein
VKKVFTNLWCGSEQDFYNSLLCTYSPVKSEMELLACMPEGWAIVHACKEPFHRMALQYTGRGAPKDDPEYLWSERTGNRLALNMVDAPSSLFFDKSMIDKALEYIEQKLSEGFKVLVHCNEGFSRSPSLCLIYLIKHGIIKGDTLEDCEAEFLKVYPEYNPGTGMRGFVKEHFNEYILK